MRDGEVECGLGFRLAHWEVHPERGTLAAGSRSVHLEPRVMDVLTSLARHAGHVVTRAEFMREVWRGRPVTDEVLSRCISLLRTTLDDDPRAPVFIETVPKIGYRLIAPIAPLEPVQDGPHPAPAWKPSLILRTTLLTALIAIASIVAVAWRMGATDKPAPRQQLSIAVLPFVNMTSDPDSESFVDGISEEVLGALAGIQGLKVAGRTSSFYFKGRNPPLAEVARMLKVSHVLEGSVRREGQHLRISTELTDLQTGFHVWSQTFDRELTGTLDIQEDIARSVANALQLSLLASDESRLRRRISNDPGEYQAYLLARTRMKLGGDENLRAAKATFEGLIEHNPRFAAAHAGLAAVYAAQLGNFGAPPDTERLAWTAANRAVGLDAQSSEAYRTRGRLEANRYLSYGDYPAMQQASADFRRAIELDQSNTDAYMDYGFAVFRENPELALNLYRQALEIDPLDRRALLQIANTLRLVGRFDEARERYREIMGLYPDDRSIYEAAALLERLAGRLDDAAVLYEQSTASAGNTFASFYRWSVYMALGDETAAARTLEQFGDSRVGEWLQEASRLSMIGHFAEALDVLDVARHHNSDYGRFGVAAAQLALMTDQPARALQILEQRVPGLVADSQPIDAVNCIAALELAVALARTGHQPQAQRLLDRVAEFLDGARSPRGPTALFLRAETYALTGDLDSAMDALDSAYDAGFRTTWAVSMTPSLFYCPCPVEKDPRLGALRKDPRFLAWLDRVRTDNARQLGRLRARMAALDGDARRR